MVVGNIFSIQEKEGNVGNEFVENFQSLTEGSHSIHVYTKLEIKNTNLEML